jgi:hypothetical protein
MLSWIPKSKCNGTTVMENTVFCRSDVWGYLGILVKYKGVSLGNAYRRQSALGLFSHCCGTLEGTPTSCVTSGQTSTPRIGLQAIPGKRLQSCAMSTAQP